MSRFDSINVGDRAELFHRITESDIDQFVQLTGDDNKLHVDKQYASTTSFKKPVVHGMLGASFISTIIGTKLPGDGALWVSQSIEFLLPVRVGDTIRVEAEVIKKIDRSQLLELSTNIYNQQNEKVLTGKAQVKVISSEVKEENKKPVAEKKVALVIGGTGGIGSAACLQLAKDGFDIAVHYFQNKSRAEELKNEISELGREVMVVQADTTQPKEVEMMVQAVARKLKTVTVLVNSATHKIPTIKLANLEWHTIQEHLDINVKAAFNLQKNIVPLMEPGKYGKIINITTLYVERPNPELVHYVTGKAALQGFSKALALELAPKGIRVNIVSPGMTETDLTANISERTRLVVAAQTPLKTLASPADVAGVISFLASPASDYLTGETIRVNGGQLML